MEYKRIKWIDDDTELSAENFNHMEEGIENSQNVELIAVTDTAPSTCTTGDKYYNTTDNLIYTATGTNTWDTIGQAPIEGIFYIVFSEQSSYSYNGTTLISVGGGTEDIIISQEQPTTEDWKIWIDTNEVQNLGSEVVDTLDGNETNKAPSVRAVNGIIESGNNENGYWIKFADGTLIQHGSKNCTATESSSGGFTHYYSQNTFTFPVEFKNTYYKIFGNINSENVTLIHLVYGSIKTTSTYGLNFISSSNNDTRTIQWFAIGRWK